MCNCLFVCLFCRDHLQSYAMGEFVRTSWPLEGAISACLEDVGRFSSGPFSGILVFLPVMSTAIWFLGMFCGLLCSSPL